MKLRKNLFWLAIVIITALIQSTWPDMLKIQGVTPDLTLLLDLPPEVAFDEALLRVANPLSLLGDGRRDLVHSVPDLLASTANFLKGHGWQAGAPWGPGTANYSVIKDWNRADVYARTIAVMADRLS